MDDSNWDVCILNFRVMPVRRDIELRTLLSKNIYLSRDF